MRFKNFIFIFSLFMFHALNTTAFGSEHVSTSDTTYRPAKDTSLIKNKIIEYSKNLTSFESNFLQKKSLDILANPIVSEGYFAYKKDMMLRWEYTNPFNYIIVMNNNRMFIKDNEKIYTFELSVNNVFLKLSLLISKLVQGNIFEGKKEFSYTFFENNVSYKVVLNPLSKELKPYFKKIDLIFDKKQFSVSRVQLYELTGDITCIDFVNKKINGAIPDEKFTIK